MGSIGVTISPNIMINFVVEAAKQIPDKIQAVVPPITVPYIAGVPGTKGIPPAAMQNAPSMNLYTVFKTWKADYINEILLIYNNKYYNNSPLNIITASPDSKTLSSAT